MWRFIPTARLPVPPPPVGRGRPLETGRNPRLLRVIFATGVSQMQTLDALTSIEGLPWDKIRGFHMDEYIGISADHPASFRWYLRERLTRKVSMNEFYEIDGSAPDPEKTADEYSALLRAADPQLCLLVLARTAIWPSMTPVWPTSPIRATPNRLSGC